MVSPHQEKTARRAETGLAVALVGLLLVLLVPLAPWLLDLLLVVNLSLSILVILLVLSTERPLDLSTFPSVLLFASLLRLALNVASTRLILLDGDAGEVVQAFGEFVVGGNLIVGVVIFLILVLIQFVVITKGAGRISEVAARFTLDAMPGKQMAIDADLNAGLLRPEDAVRMRSELTREAEFYGAMDGASKFVRGDAIAGLIITAINILGGVGIALSNGMSMGGAFATYTLLTVGDGLVSQIPALIVATSGAVMVTKASTETSLARELSAQVTGHRRGLVLSAAIVGSLGLVPGLPSFPFLALGGVLYLVSRSAKKAKTERDEAVATGSEGDAVDPAAELQSLLQVDSMGLELGVRLIDLVDANSSGGLLGQIGQLRKRFAQELGILLPAVRVTDNVRLPPSRYRILVHGEEVVRGDLHPGRLLAIEATGRLDALEGERTSEPTFGLPAVWIAPGQKSRAEMQGCTVVDPVTVVITHLSETIRSQAHEILTRDDVKELVEGIRDKRPAVIDELLPNQMSYGELHKVLRCLLSERVSIRNLAGILEVLSENAGVIKESDALAEMVRRRLSRSVVSPYLDEEGTLKVITLDPEVERALMEVAADQPQGAGASVIRGILDGLARKARELLGAGDQVVVLVRADIRTFLRDLLQGDQVRASVLSYGEAAGARAVEAVGVVRLEDPAEEHVA